MPGASGACVAEPVVKLRRSNFESLNDFVNGARIGRGAHRAVIGGLIYPAGSCRVRHFDEAIGSQARYIQRRVRGAEPVTSEGTTMSNDNSFSLSELNDRIAILRDNIRQLVEQAAASSGAQDEERTSARMAQQQAELDRLVKARDAMVK